MPKKTKSKPELIKMFFRATIVMEQTERNKELITNIMNSCSRQCALADGDPILKLTTEGIQGVCLPKRSHDILTEMPPVELKPKTNQPEKTK